MSFHQLTADLQLSSSEVHASFQRARLSSLFVQEAAKSVNRSALLEFFRARTSLCLSAEREDLARGLPTAYAAEPLKSALQSSTDPLQCGRMWKGR